MNRKVKKLGVMVTIMLLLVIDPLVAQQRDKDAAPVDDIDLKEEVSQGTNTKSTQDKFNIVFEHNWESNEVGVYDRETWEKDWFYPGWRDSEDARHEEVYVIKDPTTGSKAFQMFHPEGCVGCYTDWTCDGDKAELRRGGGDYWTSFFTDDPYDELYFSYNVMFRPGFIPAIGGKLPFLAGGPVNMQDATKPNEDMGFDCLLMWNVIDEDNRETTRIQFYIYHQNCPHERFAESRPWARDGEQYIFDVSDSTWYNITVRIKMNSWTDEWADGNRDGFIEGFIDGQFIMGMYDLEYLHGKNMGDGIDRVIIGSWFGGCSVDNAAQRDEWIWLDDFIIYSYGEDEDVPRGFERWPPDKALEILRPKFPKPPEPEADTMHVTAPLNLRATTVGGTFMTLAWDYPPDSLKPKGYKVYWLDKEGVALGQTYTIGNLRPNTIYNIYATSYDNYYVESDSSEVLIISTTAPDTIPPTMPTNLRTVWANERTITIAWDGSEDNVEVDGYLVYVDGLKVAQSFINEYSVLGLQASTSYNIAVAAVDAEDNKSPQTPAITVSTTAPDLEPPTVPNGLTTTLVTQNSIGIDWEPSTDNVEMDGYYIYVNGVQRATSRETFYTLVGLKAGFEYVISVSGFDHVDNESSKSDTIKVRTQDPDAEVGDEEEDPAPATAATLPEVKILEVISEENAIELTRSHASIKSYGHVETLEYGVTLTQLDNQVEVNSRDTDFDSNLNTLFLIQKNSEVVQGDRVKYGLQALYDFSEGTGDLIQDISGEDPPLDLRIQDPSKVSWLPGQGLKVEGNTIISSEEVPTRLIEALKSTDEISLEAWVRSSEVNQSGPARIISISKDNFHRAATLGQVGDPTSYNYSARMNTTEADENGFPEVFTQEDFISLHFHHVVYTRDFQGSESIYINGVEVYSGTRGGDLSSLDNDYLVSIANELSGERPWQGTFYMLAIYNKALFSHEVIQHYNAGPGEIRFETELAIDYNTLYEVRPFVLTDQGIVFGALESVLIENVLYNQANDSLYMKLYPNPSNGDIYVHIDCALSDAGDAFLRVTDMMGQVVYNLVMETLPVICEENSLKNPYDQDLIGPQDTGLPDTLIPLSGLLNEGIYSVMLVVGDNVVTERMIIDR